jgi:hypothetical protein
MNEINFVINLTTWKKVLLAPHPGSLHKGARGKERTDPNPLPIGERVRVRGK